jgi:hypothetical protein
MKTSSVADILGLNDPKPREVERNRKGTMTYDHKTGGSLQVFTNESWNRNKHYYVPNGARSAVKNFSKSICA